MSTATKAAPITVSATVNAPIEKVWQYWTAPEHITQWNSPSPDWHTPTATNDLRIGGKFSSIMAARDGSMSFDFNGEYVDIQDNQRIEYNIADGRNVVVTFEQEGNSVKVTETFDPENMNSLEMQQGGWQAILDSFKKYTEVN